MPELVRFVEAERGERPCACGCGNTWLVSRGTLWASDTATPVIVVPTIHGADRAAWTALLLDDAWVHVKSWLDGDNLASACVDAATSPVPLTGDARSWTRAEVLADPTRKARAFARLDRLAGHHAEFRELLRPEHGRDFSCTMPDCVFAQPADERSPNNQQNFAEHAGRLFVRALLPIAVADGSELRIGIWVEVPREQFLALYRVFWDDEAAYLAAELTGTIETSMQMFGRDLRGERVTLAARTADQCLFVRSGPAALTAARVPVRVLPELFAEIAASRRSLG